MFRFTIRDLAWLMLVVGLVISGGIERRRATHLSTENEVFKRAIENSGLVLYGDRYQPILRNRPRERRE